MNNSGTTRKADDAAALTHQNTAGTRPDNPAMDAALAHVTDRDRSITDELEEPRPHLVVDSTATPRHEEPHATDPLQDRRRLVEPPSSALPGEADAVQNQGR